MALKRFTLTGCHIDQAMAVPLQLQRKLNTSV